MVHLDADEKVLGHVATRWKGRAAVLTLTARRLLVSRTTRLPRRTDRTLLAVDWPDIAGTAVEGADGTDPRLVLETLGGDRRAAERYELAVDDPRGIQRVIDRQIEAARKARRAEARSSGQDRPTVHLHVTLHPPASGSPTSAYVRCPYCRTVYRELDGKCPSCGAAF